MGITRAQLRFPSPALIAACLALFVALGGGAYAASSTSSKSIHFTDATLENGWVSAHGGYAKPGYAKDSLGVVHLRGAACCASDTFPAFALPRGMRPKHNLVLPVFTSGGTLGWVEILVNGVVLPQGSRATSFTSLDGISFVAGQ
jgi:hypothetical protein